MSPIEQAFEIAYLRDRDINSPITKDALLRGADGQYFHQHMRTYFQFFCMGYSAGATDAQDAHAKPEPEPPALPAAHRGIDPKCDDCEGKGDGNGGPCYWCHWEIPF